MALWRELCEVVERTQKQKIDERNLVFDKQSNLKTKDNVYTLEVSFAGRAKGNHFTTKSYFEIGESLIRAIGIYSKFRYEFIPWDSFLLEELSTSDIHS